MAAALTWNAPCSGSSQSTPELRTCVEVRPPPRDPRDPAKSQLIATILVHFVRKAGPVQIEGSRGSGTVLEGSRAYDA
eukprot:2662220-Rhodomonas_salina.1